MIYQHRQKAYKIDFLDVFSKYVLSLTENSNFLTKLNFPGILTFWSMCNFCGNFYSHFLFSIFIREKTCKILEPYEE